MYNILIVCLDWPALYVEIRERRDEEKAERQRLLDEDETRAAFGDAYGRANDEEKNKANTVE